MFCKNWGFPLRVFLKCGSDSRLYRGHFKLETEETKEECVGSRLERSLGFADDSEVRIQVSPGTETPSRQTLI